MPESNPVHESIAALFCVLHDGVVARASHADGSLVLTVQIGYVAERLTPSSRAIRVTLRDIRDLLYFPWSDPGEGAKPPVLADEVLSNEVDILEGEVSEEGIVIVRILRHGKIVADVGGELRFTAEAVEIHDEHGITRSVAELQEAGRAYWAEWSARNASPR